MSNYLEYINIYFTQRNYVNKNNIKEFYSFLILQLRLRYDFELLSISNDYVEKDLIYKKTLQERKKELDRLMYKIDEQRIYTYYSFHDTKYVFDLFSNFYFKNKKEIEQNTLSIQTDIIDDFEINPILLTYDKISTEKEKDIKNLIAKYLLELPKLIFNFIDKLTKSINENFSTFTSIFVPYNNLKTKITLARLEKDLKILLEKKKLLTTVEKIFDTVNKKKIIDKEVTIMSANLETINRDVFRIGISSFLDVLKIYMSIIDVSIVERYKVFPDIDSVKKFGNGYNEKKVRDVLNNIFKNITLKDLNETVFIEIGLTTTRTFINGNYVTIYINFPEELKKFNYTLNFEKKILKEEEFVFSLLWKILFVKVFIKRFGIILEDISFEDVYSMANVIYSWVVPVTLYDAVVIRTFDNKEVLENLY